jgi:hypothetical protein
MLETLEDLPPGIEGVKAVGKVTERDYAQVFAPLVDAARRDDHRLRLVYELGADFQGFTPMGLVADARLALRSLRVVEGLAVVTDDRWVRAATRLSRSLMPFPVRVFSLRDRHLGIEWLSSLSQSAGLSHHLRTDSGVLVVELAGKLRSRDFEALAITIDTWSEEHGDIAGVVVHAREFPRWADLAAVRSHVRFVRARHRHVARIAVSTDSRIGRLAPTIARRMLAPRIRAFAYDELSAAIDWAGAAADVLSARPPIAPRPIATVEDIGHRREKTAGWPPS